MKIAAILAMLLAQDQGEKFWDFAPGTQWTYEESDGTTRKKTVMTVKEKKDGKVYMESQEFPEGEKEPSKTETLYSTVKDGFLTWGKSEDGKESEMFRLLKIGSKKGEKWKSPFADSGMEIEIENAGTEKVKVAGKEYDAVHVQFTFGGEDKGGSVESHFYFAEGVGLLKARMTSPMGEMTFELKEFKAK